MDQKERNNKFVFARPLILSDFANQSKIEIGAIIKYFFLNGRLTNLNTVLTKEDCITLCKEWNIDFEEGTEEKENADLFEEYLAFTDVKVSELEEKVPVVTIMGHVDHGKTTLLDRIRGSKVAENEFGGITQHIGAYQVERNNKKITFLDTPGHQAFTKMRARGANATDIVVLVVAADDGIKPQTIEAIQHTLAAKVKIIVFINKIDKGDKKVGALKNELMEHGLVLEEFGGDVICVQGSALKGDGINELLDTILLVAELAELKTTSKTPAIGTVIESKIEKGLGSTATLLLFRGTLKCGDYLVMKSAVCKIKLMTGTQGEEIALLEPSCPAKVSGFKSLPEAGDRFISFSGENEEKAKEYLEKFAQMETKKEAILLKKHKDINTLNVIVKCDVSGSLEAIKEIIYSNGIPITASNIGPVTDVDLQLATISNALIINFNQKISQAIINRAKDIKITIKNYRSVYEIEEELIDIIEKDRIIEWEEQSLGKAKVLKLWHHSKVGTIAGCKVISGKIEKTNKIKVIRDDNILVNSTIKSFKTEAYEIKECSENQEYGIVVNNWNDIKPGDIIEAYKMVEKKE
ncbi:translation initiation factor IF-2 [Candidatus Mycoplasma haematohominis]|uniref:translation initiation factor IF-2 n=1 Tax=Candidatus Mycoplasma haematohominis TaxID=1494318 RepID=UPI001C0A6C59|nr:translation initiation factor IF-2 [Candidatus Mycoplasma haemohominis]